MRDLTEPDHHQYKGLHDILFIGSAAPKRIYIMYTLYNHMAQPILLVADGDVEYNWNAVVSIKKVK